MNRIFILLTAAVLTACQKPTADTHEPKKGDATTGVGDAVTLKAGHGLSLHPKLQQSIALKVTEVGEEKVAPGFGPSGIRSGWVDSG